ncbi:hypothetical protein EC957_003327 [Mortierella hygrophila]|uniref:F-box domain-containing protein n=1 Tax=Mortierella hygrophila TaxID=979708 RepID=A0A9P6K0J1_9FUNG|nr:hypothetical protein EC957_003327 [Mortierella hygrophila]
MSTSTASEQFFDIPELPRLLTVFLDRKDVSRLARTNRRMNSLCTPSLYTSLERSLGMECKIWESLPALLALARNIQHVRKLDTGMVMLTYYYNCALAFEELYSRTLGTPLHRPPWLPPLDIRTCQVVALPPMTRLSSLRLNLDPLDEGPLTMPSASDFRAALPQLCWVMSQNSGLTHLTLTSVPLLSLRGGRMFARALAGLSKLRTLSLWIFCRNDDWVELWKHIFFRFPSSIRWLFLNFENCERHSRYQDALEEVVHADGWKGAEVEAVTERQEPLIHLADMVFLGMKGYRWETTNDLRAMLAHCPNLKRLNGDINLADHGKIEALGRSIAEGCPKIEWLGFGMVEFDERLSVSIMSSLPAQVARLELRIGSPEFNMSAVNFAIHRHSTTLRVLHIEGRIDVIWFFPATILKECVNLEILEASCRKTEGLVIPLDDVLEHPWACTKLKQLTLAIGGCEIPYESDVEPYYRRPAPITLDKVETEHLSRLEDLYKRIGSLTALEELDLKMVPLDEDGEVDYDALDNSHISFPAMLNLPDPRTGMPGFLHHLAGLEKLRVIRGSVWADTEETERTIDWLEVTWMERHWPLLKYAAFYPLSAKLSAPFKWLSERRANGNLWLKGIC